MEFFNTTTAGPLETFSIIRLYGIRSRNVSTGDWITFFREWGAIGQGAAVQSQPDFLALDQAGIVTLDEDLNPK